MKSPIKTLLILTSTLGALNGSTQSRLLDKGVFHREETLSVKVPVSAISCETTTVSVRRHGDLFGPLVSYFADKYTAEFLQTEANSGFLSTKKIDENYFSVVSELRNQREEAQSPNKCQLLDLLKEQADENGLVELIRKDRLQINASGYSDTSEECSLRYGKRIEYNTFLYRETERGTSELAGKLVLSDNGADSGTNLSLVMSGAEKDLFESNKCSEIEQSAFETIFERFQIR